MAHPSDMAVRDIEALIHPYTNLEAFRMTGPLILERGQGIHVFDSEGRSYIEGMAGLWCTALGYGEEALVEAAAEQMRRLPFAHQFAGKSHEPGLLLAERLKAIAPVPISKVLFSNSGSEANDTQIKLVWYYNNARGKPRKKRIISRHKAYHGVTLAAASLTGLAGNHRDFDLPLSFALHAECPHHYRFARAGESEEDFATRLAANLEALIEREDPDTIAAFIAEPLMGAGGVILPPRSYFPKIEAVLSKNDILLIDDEVITGFGRTGAMWGAQSFGMTPQSISVAKALTSAYMPMSAVMLPEFIYEALREESKKLGMFGHGYTWGGHPVAAAVALKTLELYEHRNILGHVQAVAPRFAERLAKLVAHPIVGEAVGVGLIGAIELVADKRTKANFDPARLVAAQGVRFCEKEGLLLRPLIGDRIALCPPLIITAPEIDDMFDRLERALNALEHWLRHEGLLAR
jgi:4-aminobutyrate---pyruvate transaminase